MSCCSKGSGSGKSVRRQSVRACFSAGLFFGLAAGPALASASCSAAIEAAATRFDVPPQVLHALFEHRSGLDDIRPTNLSPWRLRLDGTGPTLTFDSATAALTYAYRNFVRYRTSMGVGCFLLDHHDAGNVFSSMEELMDPDRNVEHVAKVIATRAAEGLNWAEAAADALGQLEHEHHNARDLLARLDARQTNDPVGVAVDRPQTAKNARQRGSLFQPTSSRPDRALIDLSRRTDGDG